MCLKTAARLTKTQLKILAVVSLYGGQFQSLNRLAREIDINYSWAWSLLQRLETAGHIEINRSGRDLLISTRK